MPSAFQPLTKEDLLAGIHPSSDLAHVIAVPRIFIVLTGDATLALMLSQLVFWSGRAVRPDGFIYKSYQDWENEVGASKYYVQKFNALPYIETFLAMADRSPTTHYRIRFDVLLAKINELLESQSQIPAQPLDNISQPTGDFLPPHQPIIDCPLDNISQPIVEILPPHQPIIDSPLDNISQPIDEFLPPHQPIFTHPPDNIVQSLTKITTKTTTKTTPVKDCTPVGAHPAQKPGLNSKTKSKTIKESTSSPDSSHWEMMQAISKLSGFDLNVRDLAARVGRVAKQLLQAGYTPADVEAFETYWKETDWRWQRHKLPPKPTDIQASIKLSKEYNDPGETFEERRAAALKELEDYEKKLEEQDANMQF